jgi:hypothetical protein
LKDCLVHGAIGTGIGAPSGREDALLGGVLGCAGGVLADIIPDGQKGRAEHVPPARVSRRDRVAPVAAGPPGRGRRPPGERSAAGAVRGSSIQQRSRPVVEPRYRRSPSRNRATGAARRAGCGAAGRERGRRRSPRTAP